MSKNIDEKLCNLCGLSCMLGHIERSPYGLIDATTNGGYDSTPGNGCGALDDMTRYSFSLCEFCLDWLFTQFQIRVSTDDPTNDFLLKEGETIEDGIKKHGIVQLVEREQPEQWVPASERVEKDDWRKDKKEFFQEKTRRDLARFKKA
jgi:hypothetical protein